MFVQDMQVELCDYMHYQHAICLQLGPRVAPSCAITDSANRQERHRPSRFLAAHPSSASDEGVWLHHISEAYSSDGLQSAGLGLGPNGDRRAAVYAAGRFGKGSEHGFCVRRDVHAVA